MAFMMPVIKNDYNIYPSCPSSRNSTPQSSRGSSLASSPTATSLAFRSSPRSSETPGFPKSESQISLHKFHSKVLDKLKKTFRGKDVSEDNQASTSSAIAIRWCSLFLSEASFFSLSSMASKMLGNRKWSLTAGWPLSSQLHRAAWSTGRRDPERPKPDDGSIWSWCHLSSWSTTEWLLICITVKVLLLPFPSSIFLSLSNGFNRSSLKELSFDICPRTVSELSFNIYPRTVSVLSFNIYPRTVSELSHYPKKHFLCLMFPNEVRFIIS